MFKHITMSLQSLPTPVIFNLNDGQYVESILFIGFLPLLLLLVLMVALMVYYCIVNFSSDSSKSGKKRCCSANICCYMVSGKLFRLACQLQKSDKVKKVNYGIQYTVYYKVYNIKMSNKPVLFWYFNRSTDRTVRESLLTSLSQYKSREF